MKISILFLILLTIATSAAAPPDPRGGRKIIAINDDGFSQFYNGRYRTVEDLRERVHRLADTQVAVLEWCIVAGSRVNFPSPVHDLIGEGVSEYPRRGDRVAAETLMRLREEGSDTLQIVADACRESGIACYASMRMNGDYSPAAWGGVLAPFFNSNFWMDHPEYRQKYSDGRLGTRLSYAYPEVREFKLSILREAVERDIDGINLDFFRHPNFFAYEEPMLEAFEERYQEDGSKVALDDPRWIPIRSAILTEFVRECRGILDEAGRNRGRRLGLSVRVDWRRYRTWGCDIETWLDEGWLDYMVVGQYGLGGYEFDISPFVAMAEPGRCAVLFGEECILDGHDTTAAEDRLIAAGKMEKPKRGILSTSELMERASRWYADGADGVHLFNPGAPDVLKSLGSVEAAMAP